MKILVFCASFLALQAAQVSAAAPSPACAAKQVRIEAQLSEATEKGHTRQVAGLKKALRANQSNCTDASLAKERERDIREARKEVAKREKDLAEAEKKGDAQKISTRRAKLEEARSELAEAEKPLL